MKRSPELRDLSVDHHHGLVLARTARTAAAGTKGLTVEEAWDRVETTFAEHLEPHFRIEETLLAPALEAVGEVDLARRLHAEHAALRHFLHPGCERSATELKRFGDLLDDHIRFEERTLFDVAEKKLGTDALRAVAEASRTAGRGNSK
ncbi:MAG: hemerythrin domain-containing protein [Candidatus Binatia bacterium]